MKYIIEPIDGGCKETIIFRDGSTYTKRHLKTDIGSRCLDDEFSDQMEANGICEEIVEQVCDTFDGFLSSEFMDIDELDN